VALAELAIINKLARAIIIFFISRSECYISRVKNNKENRFSNFSSRVFFIY
jgi:hypothetical protein